jgi:hypothetical protein
MSFGCGDSFLAFLDGSRDFYVGNSITIVSSMVYCKRRVPVWPVLAELPESQSEQIILSSIDFHLFKHAFGSITSHLPPFDTIKVEERIERFTSYMLEYCPLYRPTSPHSQPIVSLPCAAPDLSLDPDQVFEQAIARAIRLDGPAFEEYSYKKSIIDSQNRMVELEDIIRFAYCVRTLRGAQRSILRFRNFAISLYYREHFRRLDIRPETVIKVSESFLRSLPGHPRLLIPFLSTILNVPRFRKPPPDVGKRFHAIRQNYRAASWNDVLDFGGVRKIIELAPEPSRRSLTGFGECFRLFTHVLETARRICDYYGASPVDRQRIVKFVALGSQFDEILQLYLICNTVVLQTELFTRSFKEGITRDWQMFVTMMLETIAQDPELLAGVVAFRLV